MEITPRCLSAGILFADVGCAPIDHAPEPGELVATDRIGLSLGGCASNLSINLGRLEVPTGLCGCVGDDAFSDHILNSLANPFVDVSGVRRIPNSGPGCSLIVNVKGQDRRFISTTGANAKFAIEDIPQKWTDAAEILFIGGYLMMERLETQETVDYFKAFQAKGGKTILDVVLYGDRPYWPVLEPLMPYCDYFMPNDDEGRAISGIDDPVEQAKFFVDAGAKACVITCGGDGSIYYSNDEKFRAGIFGTNLSADGLRGRVQRRVHRRAPRRRRPLRDDQTRCRARDELRARRVGDQERLHKRRSASSWKGAS